MLCAIAADIIGSVYEHQSMKRMDVPLFDPRCHYTDNTVITVAVADSILNGANYGPKLKERYRLYPERGLWPGFPKMGSI